ncbi:hypothetical protein JXM67_04920 [candidate division WOR-3 bacterium]|nr:hypothetical protein [candidate division WOR-3 bacterium]
MMRIIQLTILAATSVGAVEITALGGGNQQTWVDDSTVLINGISWHAGAMIGEGITFSRIPLTLGVETGVIYQYERYDDIFYFQDEYGEIYDSAYAYWKYDNLVVPVLLKGSVDFLPLLNVGLGSGISVVRPLAGKSWIEYETEEHLYEHEFERSQMDTYLAWLVKGEVGYRIIPRLWIKASVTCQYKIADLSPETFVDKRAYFASLGLAYEF